MGVSFMKNSIDVKSVAEQILTDVGGKENISSVAHCMTRLRLGVNNASLCQIDHIKSS